MDQFFRRRAIYGDCNVVVLPSNYTRLEYIQSSGTQYIDTGIVPYFNTNMEIDFEMTTTGSFGCTVSWLNAAYQLFIDSQGYFSWVIGDSPTKGRTYTGLSTRLIAKKNQSYVYINGSSVGIISGSSLNTTNTLYLFGLNVNGELSETHSAKCYHCSISSGSTLERDYYPVSTVSTGAVGLYDLVSGEFFGNDGTGTFTAGPEI